VGKVHDKPVESLSSVGRGKLLLFPVEEGEVTFLDNYDIENQLNRSPCDIMAWHGGGLL
jgi:hypothetical protein